MVIKKNQLKKLKVSQLKDIMRKHKIKGLSGNKGSLIDKIISSIHIPSILSETNLPEKKKRVFTAKQIAVRFTKKKPNKTEPKKVDIVAEKRDMTVRETILANHGGKMPEDLSDKEMRDMGLIVDEEKKEIVLKKRQTISKPIRIKEKGFTDLDLLVAEIVEEAYKDRNKRKKEIKGLIYNDELSNSVLSHYENEDRIIIGFHGANDTETSLLGIKKFFVPDAEAKFFTSMCDKLDTLLHSQKDVIVGGHSMGGYGINQCVEEKDYPYTFISFASYSPRRNRAWSRNRVRKHIYTTDWLSSNMIEEDNNALIYRHIINLNTHGMKNYLSKKNMNANLIRDNSKREFIEDLGKENSTLRNIIELLVLHKLPGV